MGLRMPPLRWAPRASESGDSCTIWHPPVRRGLVWVCVCPHSAGPPRRLRKWRLFYAFATPREARRRQEAAAGGRWDEGGGGRREEAGRRMRQQCSIQNENPTLEGWE